MHDVATRNAQEEAQPHRRLNRSVLAPTYNLFLFNDEPAYKVVLN